MKKLLSVLLAALITMTPINAFADVLQDEIQAPVTESEYVVKVNTEDMAEKIENKYDADMINDEIYSVSLTDYQKNRIKKSDEVEYVEKNIQFDACETDTDLDSNTVYEQWYLDAIGVDDNTTANTDNTDEKIKIEVLDSGVDYSDEFDTVESVNLLDDGNESAIFQDSTGHGSAIVSVISSYNDKNGLEGINPNAEIYSVKVLDSNNQATLDRIIQGIYWGIENNVDIINMSLGSTVNSKLLHDAIIDAHNAGILIVAAAGNTMHQSVHYPAAYDEVLSVGSVNCKGELSDETSVGNNLDVLAPGENITAMGFLGDYGNYSGTSMATAQVTGIASLLWSLDSTKSNDFIKQLICETVNIPSTLSTDNYGIIDYSSAIENYDLFAKNYKSNKETDLTESCDFDYSDAEEMQFDALWTNSTNKDSHYSLADEASTYAGFSGKAPDIAKYACNNLDSNNKEGAEGNKIVGGPHGKGNYVINLRFLYKASRCIYDNGKGAEYNKLVNDFKNNNSYWNVKWHSENKNYDYDRFEDMVNQVNSFLESKNILKPSIKKNWSSYSQDAKNRYLGIMIFGMALHLAGDIYAHRTIVPKYTIAGTNPKENGTNANGQDMFGTNYFNIDEDFKDTTAVRTTIKRVCFNDKIIDEPVKYWNHLQLGVALQVVEFRDINMFLKGKTNPFEDNASFCEERYKASLLSCKRIAKRFKEAGTFYTKLIYPKYYDGKLSNEKFKTVKLNNFKGYTDASGLERIGVNLSESDWKINSNSTLV